MSRLGPDFTRLWAAYTASTVGSAVATDALALTAILTLSTGPLQVSLLAALAGAVGALVAIPLGPWIEFRRKRPVMVATDVLRCLALATLPLAIFTHTLTYLHLAVVAVLVATGQIVFAAASGPHLKALVAPGHLVEANGRFESVMWTSTALGPPVGGLLTTVLGPALTVLADAVSYLVSALGIRSIAAPEPAPPPRRTRERDLGAGWRAIRADPVLLPLFANSVTVSALITAMAPLLALLMLRDLDFTPFQYGLSIGVPCLAGILGGRLSRRLTRYGRRRVLLASGVARVLWLPLIPFAGPGWTGLAFITGIHTATVFFMSVFTPYLAADRLERTPTATLARVITAWSITNTATRAACTLAWGALATLIGPRPALATAALLLLATTAVLPWREAPAHDAVGSAP